ncbi:MAG TPA: hypothetical protein VIK32_06890 [Candidatus Limnocylindrales bacterium]
MSKGFPYSWETWQAGVKAAYAFVEEVERKQAAGEPLTTEEAELYPAMKDIPKTYLPDGHKRKR